jgi:hypothetical protein
VAALRVELEVEAVTNRRERKWRGDVGFQAIIQDDIEATPKGRVDHRRRLYMTGQIDLLGML